MSSFERDPPWKITIPRGYLSPRGAEWGPLLKQKLFIDWIFLFQSKILDFAMIGFHQISLNTFIRNFPFTAVLRNSKNSNRSRSFQGRTFKNNRVIASNISVFLKPEQSFYDMFKRYHQTNKLLTDVLTNYRTPGHHANFVFFLILQTPKRVNPPKTGSR